MSYNKHFTIRTDDKTRITDLCIFGIWASFVGCCGEVPRISLQNDGFILVQVASPDKAKLIEKLLIINDKPSLVTPTRP